MLGPIDVDLDTLALVDGESLSIGVEVFLIGYPGEIEEFPKPSIGRGLLSRVREMESLGITYLQTDAPVIGGQSGGALVSAMGEVIGISGFAFTEGDFGIAASSSDIEPRVRQLITGEDPSGLGDRSLPLSGGDLRHNVRLRNFWAQHVYVINESSGTTVEFELAGNSDGVITVYDSFASELLYVDDNSTGEEIGSVAIAYDEPHFLVVSHLSETPGDFTLTSSHRLASLHDPDDGQQIEIGQPLLGNIDFPGDVDYFFVHLTEGEVIEVVARSVLADTFLSIDYLGALDEQIIVDDDRGGGLFGLDSMVVYRAPHTGNYFAVVHDANSYAPGGYVITVDRAHPGATPTTTTLASLFEEQGDGIGSVASSDFGLIELRAAFQGLPTSFYEADPADLDLSIAGLGLEDYFNTLVIFVNEDPFQMIMAATGQVSESEREAWDVELSSVTFVDDVVQGFLAEAEGEESFELHASGSLESSAVGVSSSGAYLDATIEGIRLHIELIMFRRGDLVGVVYSYGLPGTELSVSVEEATRMLDSQISAVILAR